MTAVGKVLNSAALRPTVILIISVITIFLVKRKSQKDPLCEFGKHCNTWKQKLTTEIILIDLIRTIAFVGIGISLLSLLQVDTSGVMASAGISLAIIGLSIKPVADEFVYGTSFILQGRVKLWDTVHIFTKFGRWIPELSEQGVVVISISPLSFTFQYENGSRFNLNSSHINGILLDEDSGRTPIYIGNEVETADEAAEIQSTKPQFL